ncbi:MAG: EpsG family protein [Lysobacteraceae bacterium]|nr:MAG: EpsG family protein [Xanthomonadaceae bacterium]
MWPYWLMFFFPAWALLIPGRLKPHQGWVPWALVFMLFTLMMGLRHEVGGDWGSGTAGYLPLFYNTQAMTLGEALSEGDPGYYGLNWVVAQLGGSIYLVNLVCAIIMMLGTTRFCRDQPNPWLALLAAVPYMLIVVGMGYTRQAVALGFALLGLAALGRGNVRKYVIWIALGATFHKSAVLLLPIAALAASRNRMFTIALVGLTTAMLYYLLLADASEALWVNYVDSQRQSQGGMIRVAMNVLPAVLLIFFRRRLSPDPQERKLWLWIAVLCLVCLPLVGLASTAVDRIALYLIPIQLFVFSRMPRLADTVQTRTPLVLAIVVYYAAVLYVWLTFGDFSEYWVPYQNVIFT